MKKYRITCRVEHADGWQTFLVNAESEEDALARYKSGEGEFEEEEIDVTCLGEPEVEAVEDD